MFPDFYHCKVEMTGKKFGKRMTSNMSGHYDPNPSSGYHGNMSGHHNAGYHGNQQRSNNIYPRLPTGNSHDSGRNPVTDQYNGGSFGFGCHGDDCGPRDNFRGGDFSDTASDISMYTKSANAKKVEVVLNHLYVKIQLFNI